MTWRCVLAVDVKGLKERDEECLMDWTGDADRATRDGLEGDESYGCADAIAEGGDGPTAKEGRPV